MRFVAGALVLAVVAVGCTSYALPTDPEWHHSPQDPCGEVGLDGVLRGSTSDPRVFWMDHRATGERVEIIWPAGYHARLGVGLEVLDDHDAIVGRAGDRIIGRCFRSEPGDQLHISSDELRPPDWQPGEG